MRYELAYLPHDYDGFAVGVGFVVNKREATIYLGLWLLVLQWGNTRPESRRTFEVKLGNQVILSFCAHGFLVGVFTGDNHSHHEIVLGPLNILIRRRIWK